MSLKLTILGSSSAFPTANRFPTAQALNVNERFFLIDCGEGTQIQLRKNKISFARIDHIFISHLHGDHFFGLFGLLSTFSLLGRKDPLHIYAHKNLELLLKQLNYICNQVNNYELVFHPLTFTKPELLLSNKSIEAYSIPLKHRVESCGFFFKEKDKQASLKKDMLELFKIPIADRKGIKEGADFVTEEGNVIKNQQLVHPKPKPLSYAFFSDTAYTDDHIEMIKGVDLLYHEATFRVSDKADAKKTMHSTTKDAADIAIKANANKLLVGHFSSRYKTDFKGFLAEAKSFFKNTEMAFEGNTYLIK